MQSLEWAWSSLLLYPCHLWISIVPKEAQSILQRQVIQNKSCGECCRFAGSWQQLALGRLEPETRFGGEGETITCKWMGMPSIYLENCEIHLAYRSSLSVLPWSCPTLPFLTSFSFLFPFHPFPWDLWNQWQRPRTRSEAELLVSRAMEHCWVQGVWGEQTWPSPAHWYVFTGYVQSHPFNPLIPSH